MFNCIDCGVNTKEIGEYYMVKACVWRSSGMHYHSGMLCLGCLENRLGRELKPEDFQYLPINELNPDPKFNNPPKSERLLNRLGYVQIHQKRF